jgi:hypothetical protein
MANDHTAHYAWKYEALCYVFPLVMGTIFAVLNFKLITSPEVSDNSTPAFGVLLSIIIPLVIIWLVATYGAVCLKKYAYSIRDSQDGESLNHISNALILLVLYIILLPMAHTLASLALNTHFLGVAVVIGNYLPLMIALASVYLLYKGCKNLTEIVAKKLKKSPRFVLLSGLCGFIFIGFAWRFYFMQ